MLFREALSSRKVRFGAAVGLAAAALGVVLVLVVGGSSSTGLNPIAQAAERTAHLPGMRMEFLGIYSGGTMPPGFRMEGSGSFNGQTQRSQVVAQTRGAPNPPGDFTIHEVSDGFTFYMSSPLLAQGLPDGKTWMKLEMGDFDASSDPRGLLDELRATSGEVENRGTDEVRGVSTTHYAATVDLHRRADLLRADGHDDAADQVEKVIEIIGSSEEPIEVWIDKDGLVRRQKLSVPFGLLNPGARMDMTMEFFDFGIKPDVSLPPEDDVFDATEAAQAGIDRLSG